MAAKGPYLTCLTLLTYIYLSSRTIDSEAYEVSITVALNQGVGTS